MPRPTHPYLPMACGFVHLVAVMDWYRRKVLAWRLSITMDVEFCVAAMRLLVDAQSNKAGHPANKRYDACCWD